MFWLQAGVVAAAFVSVVMGFAKVHRGFILWASLAFFAFALYAVVVAPNVWVIRHLGVLSNGFLLATTLVSMLCGHPFTEAYAREHTSPENWTSPEFRGSCFATASIWASVFFANTALNLVKLQVSGSLGPLLQLLEYAFLFGGVAATSLYVSAVKKRKARGAAPIRDLT